MSIPDPVAVVEVPLPDPVPPEEVDDEEELEEGEFEIDLNALIDLASLVHRLRRKTREHAAIPAHSGRAPSAVRIRNRAKRRALAKSIESLEAQIIQWATSVVPVDPSDFDLDTSPRKARVSEEDT